MGRVGFPLKLSSCILIFLILENFCVTCDDYWCYDQPSCGPSTWGPIGSCNGMRQSPINIDTQSVISEPSLESLQFTQYENRKLPKTLKNTGYQCQVDFNPMATISGAGLSEPYTLQQMHFHWGTSKTNGAEHTIDGKRYLMELHLVHTKNNMSVEEASKQPNGLAVLALFLETTQRNKQVTPWDTLANLFKKIPEKGNSYVLNGEFSLGALLNRADLSHYYSYHGSLTTPPCSEAVKWIVIPDPLEISYTVANIMTNSLYFTTIQENRRMQNNFRPTQPLNGRSVYYYTEHKSLFTCVGHCFARLF